MVNPPTGGLSCLIMQEAELDRLRNNREAEIVFSREQNELEISKTRDLSQIEINKFKNMVDAIGPSTLQAIATAGPDMQVLDTRYRLI